MFSSPLRSLRPDDRPCVSLCAHHPGPAPTVRALPARRPLRLTCASVPGLPSSPSFLPSSFLPVLRAHRCLLPSPSHHSIIPLAIALTMPYSRSPHHLLQAMHAHMPPAHLHPIAVPWPTCSRRYALLLGQRPQCTPTKLLLRAINSPKPPLPPGHLPISSLPPLSGSRKLPVPAAAASHRAGRSGKPNGKLIASRHAPEVSYLLPQLIGLRCPRLAAWLFFLTSGQSRLHRRHLLLG